jgi:hypothetical protein
MKTLQAKIKSTRGSELLCTSSGVTRFSDFLTLIGQELDSRPDFDVSKLKIECVDQHIELSDDIDRISRHRATLEARHHRPLAGSVRNENDIDDLYINLSELRRVKVEDVNALNVSIDPTTRSFCRQITGPRLEELCKTIVIEPDAFYYELGVTDAVDINWKGGTYLILELESRLGGDVIKAEINRTGFVNFINEHYDKPQVVYEVI